MTVKERLEAYRSKKRKEKIMESIKNTMKYAFSWSSKNEIEKSIEKPKKDEENNMEENDTDDDADEECQDLLEEEKDKQLSYKDPRILYLTYMMVVAMWISLYMVVLRYEFGTVYLVLSALFFICWNTRSDPKQPGELSAYSVFNPNCEAIEGTLDASQFEKEIRYGIGGVR
ncbi:hypothetical protein P5V15_012548 [Pogonomyrmex californicus]